MVTSKTSFPVWPAFGRESGLKMKCISLILTCLAVAPVSVAQAAPTANDQSIDIASGYRDMIYLSFSDSSKSSTYMSFEILDEPEHGILIPYSSIKNCFYYISSSAYQGPDSFTWRCSDGSWSETATCSLDIVRNPEANDQSTTVYGRQPIILDSSYSRDLKRSGVAFTLLTPPSHGTLKWGAGLFVTQGVSVADTSALFETAYDNSRTWYYTPDPGYTGEDSFTWKWNYGGIEISNTGTVSITVSTNTPPTVEDDSVNGFNGSRQNIYFYRNVTDPDTSQTRTYSLVQPPEYGTVVMPDPTKNETTGYYTPFGGAFTGEVSFTWKVHDGVTESGVATVTLNLTDYPYLPLPYPQTVSALANVETAIPALYSRGGGYEYSLVLISEPSNGSLDVCNETYQFFYTPDTDFTGMDSFEWRIRYVDEDGAHNSDIVTCDIRVFESLPLARTQKIIGMKDQTVTLPASYETSHVSYETRTYGSSARPSATVTLIDYPSNGLVKVSGTTFVYTPNPGWTGEDSFSWKIDDHISESNIATNHILVRENSDRSDMMVLVVVNDLLLPEIESEINRLLTDLRNEGYTAKLKSWSGSDAIELWQYLRSEYQTPGQFVSGAILIGHLPAGRNLTSDQITDYAFMNMEQFGFTIGVENQHIWVSRIIADDFAGGEALRIRWALDANHGYRTGVHRLPHSTHFYDLVIGAVNSLNAENMLIVWPTIAGEHPSRTFRSGGEFHNSEIHANGAFAYWDWHPSQLRYSVHSSCGAGNLGGPVNRNLLSRGGGMIFSMGSSATAYSGQNVVVRDERVDYFHVLAQGDTMGNGITRGVNPYQDFYRNIFYGDLSMPAKAAPANQIPVIDDFNANVIQGVAPLDVEFYVAASDPDGSIDHYEWFTDGFHEGIYGPTTVSEANSITHTYTHPHRFEAEVQVVDNYQARLWSTMEVCVAPNPSQVLNINCGHNITYYSPQYDYVAADETLWLHDQRHADGTWGYSGGSEENVSQDVVGTEDHQLYQRFREGESFSYRIPLPNGEYTIQLHFADMRSSAGGERLMDVDVQGFTRVEGLDPAAEVGIKTAMVLPLNVVIEDEDEGTLEIEVSRNAAATQDAFLNAIEIEPGMLTAPNGAPYTPDQAFTGQAGQDLAMTLAARDPEADPLIWSLMSEPVNGTLSGTLPHLVYTPNYGFSGTDNFTVKVNDSFLDSRIATVSIDVLAVPMVALTLSDDETVFSLPANVLMQADVGLLGQGSITKVEFFRDDLLLHEATSEPYEYLWEGITLPGTYRLWARATTADGIATDSDPIFIELVPQSVFTWQNGVTGHWSEAENWTPEGFANTNSHACVVSNGTARTSSTVFQPTLTLLGENGIGGELELAGNATTGQNGIRLAGGRIWRAGNYKRTLNAQIEARTGTVSYVHVAGYDMSHLGELLGTGTVRVEGTKAWSITKQLENFHGLIEVDGGRINLPNNGTFAFGEGARIRLKEEGIMALGKYGQTWSIPGGVLLNGGRYMDYSDAGTTWTPETPWTVESESVIETADSGGFVDIRGPIHGSGTLNISRAAGSGDRAVTLRGSNSTYSGLIQVSSSPTNAFLYLGHSEAVANEEDLASLSIDAPLGADVPGLVVIGARKSGSTVENIDNVHIKMRCMILDGAWIEAGVYDQANPGPTEGFIVFHNPLSSIEVMESDPGVPPEITSYGTASGALGQPFTYEITGNGTTPIYYSAAGLPAGLSLDGTIISGIPTVSGTFSVIITASNLAGTDTLELTLELDSAHEILASCEPGGTIQPSGTVFVADGSNQVFTILADTGHVIMDVSVDGETVGTVTNYLFQGVTQAHEIQARFHEVRFVDTTCGGDDSKPTIRFDTLSNRVYEVIYKDDLLDTSEWQSLTNITGTGEQVKFVDPDQAPRRFYRLKLLD